MRAMRWWFLLLIILGVGMGGCQRSSAQSAPAGITVTVDPVPPRVGEPATVTIILRDAQGNPVNVSDLRVVGSMTHAGMKPVVAKAREISPGRYVATLEFTMGGDWFIVVQGVLPDGEPFEHTVDIPGVEAKERRAEP